MTKNIMTIEPIQFRCAKVEKEIIDIADIENEELQKRRLELFKEE